MCLTVDGISAMEFVNSWAETEAARSTPLNLPWTELVRWNL